MQFSLLNSSANSSGEALQFRIAVKCSDLVNLLKSIGNGITLSLEYIDKIINDGLNKDKIEYKPYLDFDKVNSYLNKDSLSTENTQEIINNTVEDVLHENKN